MLASYKTVVFLKVVKQLHSKISDNSQLQHSFMETVKISDKTKCSSEWYISFVCVSYDWQTAHKAEFHMDKNAQSQCQAQI